MTDKRVARTVADGNSVVAACGGGMHEMVETLRKEITADPDRCWDMVEFLAGAYAGAMDTIALVMDVEPGYLMREVSTWLAVNNQ